MSRVCIGVAALLLCAGAAPATAEPLIDWNTALFYEDMATPTSSVAGKELHIVGTISRFDGPLASLNANMPAKEYTLYMHGMISNGTSPGFPFTPYGNLYVTRYTGGSVEIYEDDSPDAVFAPSPPNAAVPSTFTDGVLVLSGNVSLFYWQSDDFGPPTWQPDFDTGVAEGAIDWTGGVLYERVLRIGGQECPGLFTGGITWYPPAMRLFTDYLFRHDGKIDLGCPTPTLPSTWGRVKSIYR